MLATHFQRIVLASRPQGAVTPENFRLEVLPIPAPENLEDGQVLIRNLVLSIDPYMRVRMDDVKSYAAPQALDACMIGAAVGEIVASRNPNYQIGEQVIGLLGWTEYAVSDGLLLRKLNQVKLPLSCYLGCAGMPGMTAWFGLNQILLPKAGETIAVSAASGAVGSVLGQLAKMRGCRVVGIAGGRAKCDYVVQDLGFDACVDYKAENFLQTLAEATPAGIDGLFENVGGSVFDACLNRMNAFGKIALCGMISAYENGDVELKNIRTISSMRLTMRGFIITEHLDLWPQGLRELEALVADGKIHYRETIADGLQCAPQALIDLLQGKNWGKQLVRLR